MQNGGAILASLVDSLTIVGSNFTQNTAEFVDGGALGVIKGQELPGIVRLDDCLFSQNTARMVSQCCSDIAKSNPYRMELQ